MKKSPVKKKKRIEKEICKETAPKIQETKLLNHYWKKDEQIQEDTKETLTNFPIMQVPIKMKNTRIARCRGKSLGAPPCVLTLVVN